jgi:hypothetical protein
MLTAVHIQAAALTMSRLSVWDTENYRSEKLSQAEDFFLTAAEIGGGGRDLMQESISICYSLYHLTLTSFPATFIP